MVPEAPSIVNAPSMLAGSSQKLKRNDTGNVVGTWVAPFGGILLTIRVPSVLNDHERGFERAIVRRSFDWRLKMRPVRATVTVSFGRYGASGVRTYSV